MRKTIDKMESERRAQANKIIRAAFIYQQDIEIIAYESLEYLEGTREFPLLKKYDSSEQINTKCETVEQIIDFVSRLAPGAKLVTVTVDQQEVIAITMNFTPDHQIFYSVGPGGDHQNFDISPEHNSPDDDDSPGIS